MKKVLLLAVSALLTASSIFAQTPPYSPENEGNMAPQEQSGDKNNWGGKLIKSPFGLGLDIQTKYIWRGMEMMPEKSAPVMFPSINYAWEGLYVYAMGGYAVNGHYAEVDLGISYTWKDFTLGFNDYYYPTTDTTEDKYLGGGKHTGHWFELALTYAPAKIPLWATVSNFFAGADKYLKTDASGATAEKQAYSTYLEVGTYYDFLKANRIALGVGACVNRSCYNGYEHGFSVCNIDLKYTYNVHFRSGWSLPLSAEYIFNPVRNKSFVNFTANFAF